MAVIAGNHQHEHQQDENSGQCARQNMPDHKRQTELVVQGAEFLKFGIPFRCFAQRVMHGFQINRIQIPFFRKRLVLADDMPLFRDRRSFFDHLLTYIPVRNDLTGDPGAHLGSDHFGFRRIIHVIHQIQLILLYHHIFH